MYSFTKRLNNIYEQALDFDFFGLDDHSGFWNFGYWLESTENHRQACKNLMEKMLAFIPDKKGMILDVACGKGATTRYLLKYYKPENVTGINISAKQLQHCRKNAPGCTFLLMDATHLKFADNSFDNIICVEAATPKFEAKRQGASHHSNGCIAVTLGGYSASNFEGSALKLPFTLIPERSFCKKLSEC